MNAFLPADILLPKTDHMEKWAVIACDQFTSDQGYWDRVRKNAEGAVSTINLILPEAELGTEKEAAHTAEINATMKKYVDEGVFTVYPNSYIYVERTLENGSIREGLVGMVDLDAYDYNPGATSAIRAEWEFLTKTLGVDIVVLDTPILDTTQYKDLLGSVITDIVLAVLSFGAQLEVDTKSKAQAEGIAAAHLKGVKFGRPRCTVEGWDTYYPQWKQGQITAVQCYKQLGISASTFYRLVRKYELEDESE